MNTNAQIIETDFNLIGPTTQIEGELRLSSHTKVFGRIKGKIIGEKGSRLVLTEMALIEGQIACEEVLINGFVEGEIVASKKIFLSQTARVKGNLEAPQIIIEHGAHFEGSLKTIT